MHAKQCRHISPLITSVSSCTSSIVGHGSAICARGIFSQDLPFSPSAAQIWSPQILLVPLLSSAAHRAAPSLRSEVQAEKVYQHLALRSEKKTRMQTLPALQELYKQL